MIFFIALICIVITLVVSDYYTRRRGSRWKELSKFPGNPPLPIIGNVLDLGFDADASSQKMLAMWEKHGKQNFRISAGFEDWLMISDPDDIKTLLNDTTELGKAVERNKSMTPFFGNSISTSEGERWKFTRRLVTPSFHFSGLEKTADVFNKNVDQLFDFMNTHSQNGPLDMYKCLRPYMLDILCQNLFGVKTEFLKDPDNSYLKESRNVLKILTYNYFSYWRNIGFLFKMTPMYTEMQEAIKVLKQQSKKILKARKEILNEIIDEFKANNKNTDMDLEAFIKSKLSEEVLLDRLILTKTPNGTPLPDSMIEEEITLLSFSSHLTTSLTMSHTLYFLAKYPEKQKKVLEEQMSIFGDDFYKKATSQETNQMKYLEATIKESMRFIPTLARIGRQLKNDMKFKDGRVAPAGTSVILFVDAASRNPKVFENPEEFRPERFFEPMHPFAFVPFSAGPRNCVAFKYAWIVLKTTLSNIIRRYEILPGVEPNFAYRVITESTNGIQLNLKKRDACAG